MPSSIISPPWTGKTPKTDDEAMSLLGLKQKSEKNDAMSILGLRLDTGAATSASALDVDADDETVEQTTKGSQLH